MPSLQAKFLGMSDFGKRHRIVKWQIISAMATCICTPLAKCIVSSYLEKKKSSTHLSPSLLLGCATKMLHYSHPELSVFKALIFFFSFLFLLILTNLWGDWETGWSELGLVIF